MSGKLIGVLGIPGTGKSHFARSCAEVGPTSALLLDPGEREFYERLLAPDRVAVLWDEGWRPFFGEYQATAYTNVMKWLGAQADGDATFIVIDPASEITHLAMHEILKLHKTDDPSALEHGRAYTQHNNYAHQFLQELRRLRARGKTVVAPFHVAMREAEGVGQPVAVQGRQKDATGKLVTELRFEERLMPVLLSNFRQHVAGYFDAWLTTVTEGAGVGLRRFVSPYMSGASLAKTRLAFREPAKVARIPNTMKAFLEVLA